MAKGQFVDDTFEKLVEMGQTTAKNAGKQVAQTFSPLKILENALGQGQSNQPTKEKIDELKKKNNTPLDLNKLQQKYDNQDKFKTESLRKRLFQLTKSGEEKSLQEERGKKMQKVRQEIYETQTKKRQAEEKKRAGLWQEIPHGKERRSIFSAKKVAKREQVEVKPASGKQ